MTTRYDDIATWYADHIASVSPAEALVVPEILRLTGDVKERRVCDLACGEGHLARLLQQQGAQVTGVDLSAALIDLARQKEQRRPLGVQYRVDDAQHLSTMAAQSVDACVSNLALMDIPDLVAVVEAVKRVLIPGGSFTFSVTHPCFQAPGAFWNRSEDQEMTRVILKYFDEEEWRSTNPAGVRGRVGAHHRTLTTYVNTLVRAGFALDQMSEPRARGPLAQVKPEYAVVPPFLVMRWLNEISV